MKRFKTNYEYFEVCQNECEKACDGLTEENECQSACDELSDQGCTFKNDESTMNFYCYFNYQEEDITYTIDATNQYGMLSCNDGKSMDPLINPKCSVGSLIINTDTSYTSYSDSDNPIASCPDNTGDNTRNTDIDFLVNPIACRETDITYLGTEKEIWDQIYYNGDRNLLAYRKPTCAVKNTEYLDQETLTLCSSVSDENKLLISDICEGRGSNLDDGADDDQQAQEIVYQASRAEKCAWIPPTGQYGEIENDYYSCQSTCTETTTPSVPADAALCAEVSDLGTPTACQAIMTTADQTVTACTYTDASTSTLENYILPKCYGFNDDCPTTYSTTEHDTECEAIFGCNYEKKNTCFENTDTDNVQCEEGYKRKVNPPSTVSTASEDLHTHCCEPRINYCTDNLDSTNNIICENGFLVNDPENDKKPTNQDATTEEINTQCCISSNILRISVNIKDDDATGGFTIFTVNNNRELIENNFKLDMIDIINNKLDFQIEPLFEISEIEIVSIETDLMLNCVKFIFDINRDGLDSNAKDTIKQSLKEYFDRSQLLENLSQSTLPSFIILENVPIKTDDSDKIYGYPSEYVYGSIGLFVFSCICSCCLLLLMLLI